MARKQKIVGFRITVYCLLGGKRYPDYSVEYGNSPIRDKKFREAFVTGLEQKGADFEVTPITRA